MTEQHSMFVRLRERVTEIFHELQDSRPELTPNQSAAIALERAQAEIMSSNEKPPTANAVTPAPTAPAATKTVPLSHEGRGDSTRPPTAAAAAQSVATTAADRLPPSRSPTPPAAAAAQSVATTAADRLPPSRSPTPPAAAAAQSVATTAAGKLPPSRSPTPPAAAPTTPAGDWRFINGNPRNLEKLVALGVSSLGALISVVAAAIATDDSALPPPPWPSAAAAATAGVVVEIELLKVLAFAGSARGGVGNRLRLVVTW